MGLRTAVARFVSRPPAKQYQDGLVINFPEQAEKVSGTTSRTRILQVGQSDRANSYSGESRMRDYRSYLNAITIPSVYMAASVIAYNYAAAKMIVYDDNEKVVDVKHDAPELWRLLRQPNEENDGFEFRELMAYDLSLTGNSFIALDNWTADGIPTEMYRLRPDKVRILRRSTGELRYAYDVTISGTTESVYYEADEIIHQRNANPRDPLWGIGVIEAGELSFSSDRRINEMILSYVDRGAILDGVITTDGEMSDDEYDRLTNKWRTSKGTGKATFKTAILWQGAKYQPIQEPMGSVPIVELKKMARNEVLQLFGVPPAKVGDFTGTNYRNAQEADAFFWSETVEPMLRRSERKWDRIVELFGDYHVGFDVKEVIDYVNRAITAQRLATTGGFTRNDIRIAAGWLGLPADDPMGQVYLCTSPGFQEEPDTGFPLDPNGVPMAPDALVSEDNSADAGVEQGAQGAQNPDAGAPSPGNGGLGGRD